MAEYAELVNNQVARVLVVSDNMNDEEALSFLATVSNNQWVKTDSKVSKDDVYLPDLKVIIKPKPFDSWTLDPSTNIWIPPVPRPLAVPLGYIVKWSEELKDWIIQKVFNE